MKPSSLFCLLAALFIPISVVAKDYVTNEQLPEWFSLSLARESDELPQTRLSLQSFPINAKGLGSWSEPQQVEDYWYFTVDIGSETPIECWAFKDYDGLANSLVNMMNYAVTNVSQEQGKTLESRYNFSLDISTLERVPVFSYEILYNLGESSERASGLMKGLSAESPNGLQVCLHNEIGYRKTFKDVFISFVNAVDRAANIQPFYFAINGMKMQGELVGIVSEKFSKDADGDIEIIETTSLILPVDANTVSASDSQVRSWSYADGTLINTYSYTVENGELSSSLGISKPEEKWVIEGEVQGKAVNSELSFNDAFVSNFGAYLEMQRLANSENNSLSYNMWNADTDPTQPTRTILHKRGQEDGLLALSAEIENIEVEYSVDEEFVLQEAQINMGPVKFFMKPLYVFGKPTNL